MGIAGEVGVGVVVGRAPPPLVFVVAVEVGPHHVEGHHAHHATGTHGTRVARAEVGGADKGIHPVGRLLLGRGSKGGEKQGKKKSEFVHGSEGNVQMMSALGKMGFCGIYG